MMYAVSPEGVRIPATARAIGSCQFCGDPLSPRCTKPNAKYSPHWAHRRNNCDPWSEPETEWHRNWKALFPETWREIVHFDSTGEKHVADVKTGRGTILEFQNSPMSATELQSREAFYGSMEWIVNADKFRQNFFVFDALPDPDCEFSRDIIFHPQRRGHLGRCFFRVSDSPTNDRLVHFWDEIESEIASRYIGHHLFDWQRRRAVWYEATKTVYFDFGANVPSPVWGMTPRTFEGGTLLQLTMYGSPSRQLRSVRFVSKQEFIDSHL